MSTDPNLPTPEDHPKAAEPLPGATVAPKPPRGRFGLSPLNQRRWRNFKKNRRALWSLWIFSFLFGLSLFAEFIANDKPIVVSYRGETYMPIFNFYPETTFGGDFRTEAQYRDPEVQCLIVTGGLEDCFDDPEGLIVQADQGTVVSDDFQKGWMLWPLIPYSYKTPVERPGAAPLPPNVVSFGAHEGGFHYGLLPAAQRGDNLLGTDDTKRDVMARIIYGFRLSILYTLIVTTAASVLGIIAGALQGYFGGWLDLIFQRFIEIWSATPGLYIIIIMFAIFGRSFWLLVILAVVFGWTGLVGVVRAEFLRARNLEYVRAAKALGVSNWTIMFRHMLPNAMVATLTFLPFIITGTIGGLATLDYLGYGLPSDAPSLGELTLQAKQNLQAPWLAFTSFTVFAVMLSLLVFIFEGVRDAFDPRKTFS
ncbi:ABC transporter permease [Ponticoccus litoralis]|uniref:ABC transporter permease n=1 Tax=Ponticoccus litoralis TaxID=422297 RepID=A0AAW9SLN3_9RHOB